MFKKFSLLSIILIIVIVAVAITLGGLYIFVHAYDKYNLDAKTFKEKYQSNPDAVLLDVRTPEEVAKGKIEGAKVLDFFRQDFHEQLDSLDKSKEYFIYCKSGVRSGRACDYLSKKGYKVHSLKGGYGAWKNEGE